MKDFLENAKKLEIGGVTGTSNSSYNESVVVMISCGKPAGQLLYLNKEGNIDIQFTLEPYEYNKHIDFGKIIVYNGKEYYIKNNNRLIPFKEKSEEIILLDDSEREILLSAYEILKALNKNKELNR